MWSDDSSFGSPYGPRVNGRMFDIFNEPELSIKESYGDETMVVGVFVIPNRLATTLKSKINQQIPIGVYWQLHLTASKFSLSTILDHNVT